MWSSHASSVSVHGGDRGILLLLPFGAKRVLGRPELFIQDLLECPRTGCGEGGVVPLVSTALADTLPGFGEFLQRQGSKTGGIGENILELLALPGDDAFPPDAAFRDLSPPGDEMRQERAAAVPEEMPLLAGDAFHFFNQVVEVEGLKLPGFEQRGLLLYPGIEILVVEIRLRGHAGLLCAAGSLVSGVSEDNAATGDAQEGGGPPGRVPWDCSAKLAGPMAGR